MSYVTLREGWDWGDLETLEDWRAAAHQSHGETVDAQAELAVCRERLAALVAACERLPSWDQHWIIDALDAAQEELDRG